MAHVLRPDWHRFFFLIAYYFLTEQLGFLVLNRNVRIEVNGVPVPRELLETRAMAIVTRRDLGSIHSYMLRFAGDIDMNGDMGDVVDCHEWVAPHVPILPATQKYPPCDVLPEDGAITCYRPLLLRNGAKQFVTKEKVTIRIVQR